MTTTVDQFKALARKIERSSLLELDEFRVEAAAHEDEISQIGAQTGLTIPESVKQFYRAANGLTLRWRFRRDLSAEQQAEIAGSFGQPVPTAHELFEVTGNVRILSLTDLFVNPEFDLPKDNPIEGSFDFDGSVYSDNEFSAMLQPFDLIDDFFCMAFVVTPGAREWKLMLLSDYWIEYDSSRVTWLEDYLQFVIATWGIRRARPGLFRAHRGDRQPPLTYDPRRAAVVLPAVLQASAA